MQNGKFISDFAKDPNHVYGDINFNNSLISNVDAATFAIIPEANGASSGYVKDKNGVYNTYVTKSGPGSTETLEVVTGADLATFQGIDPTTTACDPDWKLGNLNNPEPAPSGCYDAKRFNARIFGR